MENLCRPHVYTCKLFPTNCCRQIRPPHGSLCQHPLFLSWELVITLFPYNPGKNRKPAPEPGESLRPRSEALLIDSRKHLLLEWEGMRIPKSVFQSGYMPMHGTYCTHEYTGVPCYHGLPGARWAILPGFYILSVCHNATRLEDIENRLVCQSQWHFPQWFCVCICVCVCVRACM